MKKKLLSLVIVLASLLFLTACSSESLDGTYYRYFTSSNTNSLVLSDSDVIVVSGNEVNYKSQSYVLDTDSEMFEGKKSVKYFYKDNVLTVEGDTYVKSETEKYNEIEREAKNN